MPNSMKFQKVIAKQRVEKLDAQDLVLVVAGEGVVGPKSTREFQREQHIMLDRFRHNGL